VLVDAARGFERAANGIGRNFVEDDPFDGHLARGPKHLHQVPTDAFPLAIFVRGDDEAPRTVEQLLKFPDDLSLRRRNNVQGLEIPLYVDAQPRPRLLFQRRRDFRRGFR
jgi:hypothetical protein